MCRQTQNRYCAARFSRPTIVGEMVELVMDTGTVLLVEMRKAGTPIKRSGFGKQSW